MRSKSFNIASSYSIELIGTFLIQILNLIIVPIYLNLTSQELFGLWLTIGSIVGWMNLGEMSIGMALTRRLISAIEISDFSLIRKLINSAFIAFSIIGGIFLLIAILFINKLSIFLNIRIENYFEFKTTLLILLIAGFLTTALGIFAAPIEAKQYLIFGRLNNLFMNLISIPITLIFLKFNFGIRSFALSFLIINIIKPVNGIIYLKIKEPEIKLLPISISFSEIKHLLKFGGYYQIIKIANLVSVNTDNIIIAGYLGSSFVSIFTFTGKLAFVFASTIISILPGLLFPAMSQFFEKNDFKTLTKTYIALVKFSIRFSLLIGIIYFIINKYFVAIWVGKDNYGGDLLTISFVLWIISESFIRGITSILYASSDLKKLTFFISIEALSNIILSLFLVQKFGIIGVTLGTVMSRLITIFYIPISINKKLKIEKISILLKPIIITISKSLPTLFVLLLINKILQNNYSSLFYIILFTSLGLIINFMSFEGYFLIKSKPKNFNDFINLLKNYYY